MIRVVVVDDSPFVCRLLTNHLQSGEGIQVVGTALSGLRAIDLIRTAHPDVVTLDLEMPGMNGLPVLERVMRECPVPVLMISGVSRRAAEATLNALRIGAVDFLLKFTAGSDTNPEVLRRELTAKVRIAARVKVIRALQAGRPPEAPLRGDRTEAIHADRNGPVAKSTARPPIPVSLAAHLPAVLVIGASTGGPLALRELLMRLPEGFPLAVLVVQHMPATFTRVLAEQLDRQIALPVKEACEGDSVQAGHVLVAPGDYHMVARPDGRIELLHGPKIGGHCPSIDVTMQSVAQVFGPRSRGVVLTGMGTDGTLGLVSIRARGGTTFAQDDASCVVNGMPQAAVNRGVVDHVATPAGIAQLLQGSHVRLLEHAR